MDLFEKVFGNIIELKKEEWIQIDVRTGMISKRVFGETTDQYPLQEGAITRDKAISVLLDVSTMLSHGKNSVEPHCEEDKEIIEVSNKIFKRVQKQIKDDQFEILAQDIKYYLSHQLSFEKKIELWEGSPVKVQSKSVEMLTNPLGSMIARLGQDIQRHFRNEATLQIEGLQIAGIETSPRFLALPDNQKNIELRARRFEMVLNAFADKICNSKLKAVVLKRQWKDIGKECLAEENFEKKIQELYDVLLNLAKGTEASEASDSDVMKIMCLLRAMNQAFYVTPSLAIRSALTAMLQPEVINLLQQQLLKDISEGHGIVYKFSDEDITIEYHNRSINNDHPTFPETDEQKRTLEKYLTQCKYEIRVINVMTAKLADLNVWKSAVSVEIGIPPQSMSGENKESVNAVIFALRTAGYQVQIKELATNAVWVKAR